MIVDCEGLFTDCPAEGLVKLSAVVGKDTAKSYQMLAICGSEAVKFDDNSGRESMDYGILKTVGQVAGLGGLAIGMSILVFRDIIRKTVFQNLKRDQAYTIIKLIIGASWTVALAGIGAWAYVSVAQANPKPVEPRDDPVTFHPVVTMTRPIKEQVQLFAEDKVAIYNVAEGQIQQVCFDGKKFLPFVDGKQYMVQGEPGVPVIPKFEATGEFKLEIISKTDKDKPRDINGFDLRPDGKPKKAKL